MKNLFLLTVALFTILITSCTNESITPGVIVFDGENDEASTTKQIDRFFCTIEKDGKQHISVFQEGTFITVLEDENYHYFDASVSKDESRFIVYRHPTDATTFQEILVNSELLMCDLSGDNCRVIVEKKKYPQWGAQAGAIWGPNDDKLYMSILTGFTNEAWRTFETDLDGNNPKLVADFAILDATFTANGSKIVYSAWPKMANYENLLELEIFTANFDFETSNLSNRSLLTNNSRLEINIIISPDQTNLLYWSNGKIGILDLDSKEEDIFEDVQHIKGNTLCWSKNGEDIYFVKSKSNGKFSFNLLDANNGRMTEMMEFSENIRFIDTF